MILTVGARAVVATPDRGQGDRDRDPDVLATPLDQATADPGTQLGGRAVHGVEEPGDSRWRDGSRTVLGYVRDVDRWTHNPMNGTGL
ncbi:hypothetical protein GCM10017673_35240 [Streptosporangium violaceochromogenes]|nr:hypothetical protein GCM10017673_35240 [Streptosporangium violaceochromogenes]